MDRLGDHRLRCYGFEIKEKHAELEPFVGTRMYFVVHPIGTHVRLLWSCFIFRPSWARGVRTARASLRRPLQKASFPKRDTRIGEEATVPI